MIFCVNGFDGFSFICFYVCCPVTFTSCVCLLTNLQCVSISCFQKKVTKRIVHKRKMKRIRETRPTGKNERRESDA